MYFNAFTCSCNSCIIVHSGWSAFICIIVHSQCVAFYMSCIQMHLYASPHEVHSVDTLHSDALAFLRIQAHSDAFTHTRIQLPYMYADAFTRACSLVYAFVCIRMYSLALVCIRMHSYTFVCILMHSHACSLLRNIQPNVEYLVVCSDGQPRLVASSLTDCAVMERFLMQLQRASSSQGKASS